MDNSHFDYAIENYSIKELEEILDLPRNYDAGTIETKENKMIQNIINDKLIAEIVKTKTIAFIQKVKKLLTDNIQKNNPIIKLAKTYSDVYNLDKTLKTSELISEGGTQIIKQPATPYGQSMPSEFYQGVINPLSKRILRQNINIDTRFRDNYYSTPSSNFHVDLPIKLSNVVSLQLSALELPNTFYAVSKVFGNNFFVLEIPSKPNLVVTIPDGNYDYLSLQIYINTFLTTQTVDPAYTTIQFLADVNTGVSSGGSGRMVAGSTSGTQSFSINFQTNKYGSEDKQTPLPLKLGWIMGFREGYYKNAYTYVSEGIINVTGPRYIYLVIDDFNNNVLDGFYGAFNSSVLNKNILARISLQGSVFDYLAKDNFNLITTPRQYFGPVDIQKLQVQLLDEYGRILDLNNMDYSFCLTFQTIYDL
jgi:hypothetical protein